MDAFRDNKASFLSQMQHGVGFAMKLAGKGLIVASQ
jgi:hypothetical protein